VYCKSRDFEPDKRAIEQTDRRIDFDFGQASPAEEIADASEFSIRWTGSILTDETGDYTFFVKSENGVRLLVNDFDDPLIDGWVSSGKPVEHQRAIRLLGGRVYPIRLDFFKYKDKSASVELAWKPPFQTRRTIPAERLIPTEAAKTFVVTTRFPADDRVEGYERGTSASREWVEATTKAALEAADRVIRHLDSFTNHDDAADPTESVREFCRRFARRAFRRPLDEQQRNFFVDRHFAAGIPLQSSVQRVVLLVLTSPHFLYTEIRDDRTDDYDVASRLALCLWDSLPDEKLSVAADNGQLTSSRHIARHAERMLEDPRTKEKLRRFFHHWLRVEEHDQVVQDRESFPDFDEDMLADLRTSLDRALEEEIWNGAADFRQLLRADYLYLNERLARFYGMSAVSGERFEKVSFRADERAGIVTHPYLLATLAYQKSSSPIHRGVFVTRQLLNRALKSPPVAFSFRDDQFDPRWTMREKVTALTKSADCQTCHSIINPLGFILEHFDAVGRYRTHDQHRPIDAASDFVTHSGAVVHLAGARDLAEFLASNPETPAGFVEHLFHAFVNQPVGAYGPDAFSRLNTAFAESGYNIRRLLIEIACLSASHGLTANHES
jgi:hypothetical protein